MATPLIHPAEPERFATARGPRQVARRSPHVVVTVNGPGEIAAWLFPFARALRERNPDARLTAALLPCAFASGRESVVLAGMPDVDRVLAPRATLEWLLTGEGAEGEEPDLVLHLGGELMLSILLARRLGVPVMAYEEERVRWSKLLDHVCVRDLRAAGGHENGKLRVVGNLMVDAARLRVPGRGAAAGVARTVALFPGSRPYFVRQLLPLFLRVAGSVYTEGWDVRFVLAKSDFVSTDELERGLSDSDGRLLEGDDGVLVERNGHVVIQSSRGVEVDVLSPEAAMRRADLAITIPGTSTAELACLGIPMLLVFPTYRLHTLPLPGLANHVGRIPLLGPLIKYAVASSYLRVRRFWAHPNRLANEMIVPEMVGRLTANSIARQLEHMLTVPLAFTAQRLRGAMGEPGASARLVDEVLRVAGTV